MAQIHKEKTDDFNALLQNWIGMLVRCEKETGKAFTAKLISIKGNHLLFEDINGRILMDSITSLKTAAPIAPFKNAEAEEAELQAMHEEEERAYFSTTDAENAAYARKGL